jgi:hypothetical protein
MAKGGKKMSGDLHAGLTRSNPKGDSGMRPKGGSVNDSPTRDMVAKSGNIGGREA